MGRASSAKALRRRQSAERAAGHPFDLDNVASAAWFKIGVCRACNRVGQVTTAEGMCAPAPPGFKEDRAESCLAIVERKRDRASR